MSKISQKPDLDPELLFNFGRAEVCWVISIHGSRGLNRSRILKLGKFPVLVSSEISDFKPCTHARNNILDTKYVDKTDYQGLGISD